MGETKKGFLMITGAVVAAVAVIICLWTNALKAVAGTGKENAEEKEQVISDAFDRIEISEVSADVTLREAEDGQVKVVYSDTDRITHEIKVSGNTLSIKAKKKKGGWLKNMFGGLFSFSFGSVQNKKTIVYLPEGKLEALKVETVSGDVEIPDTTEYDELRLATVSGDIHESGTGISEGIKIETVSGDTVLDRIQAGSLDFSSVSGDIRLTDADIAGTVTMETVSGDVSGNVLGEHSYSVHSLSGNKDFPDGAADGSKVSVDTTSGDVKLS